MKYFFIVEDFWITSWSFVFLAPETRQYENSKGCYLFWFGSLFELVFLSNREFEALHWDLNLKHSCCRGYYNEKTLTLTFASESW